MNERILKIKHYFFLLQKTIKINLIEKLRDTDASLVNLNEFHSLFEKKKA